MVSRHGHHHRLALAMLSKKVDAELEVCTLHFAIDGLADIVQKGSAHRDVCVEADLSGHQTRETSDLGGVIEHVLTVAGAVLQPAHEPQNFGMQVVKSQLESNRCPFLAH